CGAAHAQEAPEEISGRIAWRLRGQFAGHQGLASIGGGPVLAKGLWRPALMYGFAPPDGGRDAVHQVVLRNDVVFMHRQRARGTWFSPAMSLNVLLETGRHSYLRLPSGFPRGYYPAPILRTTLGIGGRAARAIPGPGPFRELAITAEAVGLGIYLWYAVSNRGFPLYAAFGPSFGAELRW